MSASPKMSFSGVWPTLLISRRLPGFEAHNPGLAAYIAATEEREADYTARYQEQSILSLSHPAVLWLRDQINQTIKSYLLHAGIQRQLTWTLASWYNTNRLGDHHAPHTHPRAYLSGTYYVQVPAPPADPGDPGAKPGCISFYDPRTGANMVTAGSDPDSRSAHTVLPAAGQLLMWPSPVQHYVHPNLSEEHRVSISFNVTMDPKA